jgi:hypothetical protein
VTLLVFLIMCERPLVSYYKKNMINKGKPKVVPDPVEEAKRKNKSF